jgi:hypothetical protein
LSLYTGTEYHFPSQPLSVPATQLITGNNEPIPRPNKPSKLCNGYRVAFVSHITFTIYVFSLSLALEQQSFQLDPVRVAQEPVEDAVNRRRHTDHIMPFVDRLLHRDDQARLPVPVFEDLQHDSRLRSSAINNRVVSSLLSHFM